MEIGLFALTLTESWEAVFSLKIVSNVLFLCLRFLGPLMGLEDGNQVTELFLAFQKALMNCMN